MVSGGLNWANCNKLTKKSKKKNWKWDQLWTPFYTIWIWNNYLWNDVRRVNSQNLQFTNKLSGMTISKEKFLGTTICTQKRLHEWRFARFERKNYMQQQFEKGCLKQIANFATGYDPPHNGNFPKWLVNEINPEFVLFTLSGFSNPREVKNFGHLPTSNYQP